MWRHKRRLLLLPLQPHHQSDAVLLCVTRRRLRRAAGSLQGSVLAELLLWAGAGGALATLQQLALHACRGMGMQTTWDVLQQVTRLPL